MKYDVCCPIHGFTTLCKLTPQDFNRLENIEKLTGFFIYSDLEEMKEIKDLVQRVFDKYDIVLYDALVEPGASAVKICKICRYILASDFGIAHINPINPNVMFEIGYMLGLQKNVLMIFNSSQMNPALLPFDISDKTLVEYKNLYSLEEILVNEMQTFLPELRNSIHFKSHRQKAISNPLYEYEYYHCDIDILLDGTERRRTKAKLIARGTFAGYSDSFTSVSSRLMPFEKFEIDIKKYQATGGKRARFEITSREAGIQKFQLFVEPALRANEHIEFEWEMVFKGTRIMTFEDMMIRAKIETCLEHNYVSCFRTMHAPCKDYSWRLSFPAGYNIASPQILVSRNRQRFKNEEAILEEGSFEYFIDNENHWILVLKMRNPIMFYQYGFTWIPPGQTEYQLLCANAGIMPSKMKTDSG